MRVLGRFGGTAFFLAAIVLLSSCAPEKVSPPAPAPISTSAPSPAPAPAPPPSPVLKGELKVISNLNIAAGPENITDVWAHTARDGKSYAYLGSFDQPFCSRDITGVHIVDISDPAKPVKVGFLPSPTGTRANDVKIETIKTTFFSGDILVHSAEFCSSLAPGQRPASSAGIVLYDVTDPLKPQSLAPDFSLNMEVHNTYIHQQGDRAYILVVQDSAEKDFHIVDITNPAMPVVITSRGWRDWLSQDAQLRLGAAPVPFLHDVWAKSYPADLANSNYAGKTIAYLSYWDAGLIILDITDPLNPVFLGDSDYMEPDPLTGLPPEGNSHAAVPSEDGNLVFMGDEDFAAFRTIFTVDTGDFTGEYRAMQANFTKRLNEVEGQILSGETVFIGSACTAAQIPPPPSKDGKFIALIERGVCPFDDKVSNAAAAGYVGAIVFAGADAPEQLIPMDGDRNRGNIPAFFVSRPTALAILGQSPTSPPGTPLPPTGTRGQQVTIKVTFDGWGYGRLLDVSDPQSIVELGQFATPETLLNPPPPGDHSMHNVMVRDGKAYIAWYADGIRVVDISDPKKPREIASFIDKERGSNFWGVYLFAHPDGNTYILGSDRTTGLWIFQLI